MALDRDAAQAQKHCAVVAARIATHPKLFERAARKEVADPCRQRVAKSRLEELGEKLGRTLGCLDGDIAREAVGGDDIDGPRSNIIALDEAIKLDRGLRQTQPCASGANGVIPLQVLSADIEEPDRRLEQTEDGPREYVAHQRKLHEILGVALDIGPEI